MNTASTSENNRRVCLITGASKGIGWEITQVALAQGYNVIAGSRNPEHITQRLQQTDVGDHVLPVYLDVVDESNIAAAIQAGRQQFGRIDVLINNAGYLLHGGIEELSDAEVRQSFAVNVFGLLNVTRAVLPLMRAQGNGRVINVASISANITTPAVGLYSATKAAVLMVTEALAQEGADVGVTATAICPGGVRTDFLDASSARRAENFIADYSSVHEMEEALAAGNHKQGGNPRKVAEAIISVADMDNPPVRLYLGDDALSGIRKKLSQVQDEITKHEALSKSTTD